MLWTLAKTPFCSQGIFDDDMQVVTGPREYNWTLIDQSWDYQVGLGLTPVVELSFMPVRPFSFSPVVAHTSCLSSLLLLQAILADCSWPSAPGSVAPGGNPVNQGKRKCQTIMHYEGVKEPPQEFEEWRYVGTRVEE